jgi:hypothetical protein
MGKFHSLSSDLYHVSGGTAAATAGFILNSLFQSGSDIARVNDDFLVCVKAWLNPAVRQEADAVALIAGGRALVDDLFILELIFCQGVFPDPLQPDAFFIAEGLHCMETRLMMPFLTRGSPPVRRIFVIPRAIASFAISVMFSKLRQS